MNILMQPHGSNRLLGSIILGLFFLISLGGCAEQYYWYQPTPEVLTLVQSTKKTEAMNIVTNYINNDPVKHLKLLALREPELGIYSGVDDFTRIRAEEKSITFFNTFSKLKEVPSDVHMSAYAEDLKKMVEQGLIKKENSTALLNSQKKAIRGKKVYKKFRNHPITIDYDEFSTIWINHYCETTSSSLLLTKSRWGNSSVPPHTFSLICVSDDKFEEMLSALIVLLPHAFVKEEKTFEYLNSLDPASSWFHQLFYQDQHTALPQDAKKNGN